VSRKNSRKGCPILIASVEITLEGGIEEEGIEVILRRRLKGLVRLIQVSKHQLTAKELFRTAGRDKEKFCLVGKMREPSKTTRVQQR